MAELQDKIAEVKAKIMIDHFMSNVWQAKKLKGKAKAMVVTRNIECAIRYFFAIRTALQEANQARFVQAFERTVAPYEMFIRDENEETRTVFVYRVGGVWGVVADSVPALEYQETINKASALFKAISLADRLS